MENKKQKREIYVRWLDGTEGTFGALSTPEVSNGHLTFRADDYFESDVAIDNNKIRLFMHHVVPVDKEEKCNEQ